MLVVVIVLLSAAVVWLGAKLVQQRRALRAAAQQLKARAETGSTARLLLTGPDGGAETLLGEVNTLMEGWERERADLRSREATLREQIASLSHDLRTPLTAIQGYCQLLQKEERPEERATYLAVLEERTAFLQGLINDFYELSRLESGKMVLDWEPVSLTDAVASVLADHYEALESKNFEVEVDLPGDLPCALGDGEAVRRMIQNLMRNTLEHGSGTLRVSAEARDGRATLRWENGGASIDGDEVSRVFDRYYTSDKARTGQNMGLGLAITKALADEMGAGIHAELNGNNFAVCIDWKQIK